MRLLKNTDNTVLMFELSPEEREVFIWMESAQKGKFEVFVEEYLKGRIVNMKAYKDRELIQGIDSMTPEDKQSMMFEVAMRRRDK